MGECSICSSVLPLSSSAAQDLHALEWLGTGGRTLSTLPLSWPKASTSVIFTEPGFAARCALGFSRMLIINWKYSFSFRMLGYSEIIWRGVTVRTIQTRLQEANVLLGKEGLKISCFIFNYSVLPLTLLLSWLLKLSLLTVSSHSLPFLFSVPEYLPCALLNRQSRGRQHEKH